MIAKLYSRDRIRSAVTALLYGGLAVLFLAYPQALATGVSRGLSVCTAVIIPTLFPFMVLGGFVAASPLCRRRGKISTWLMRRLFGLPSCCAAAVLIGFVGGYPAGAVALSRLRRQGLLSADEVRRCARFCINAGPGFIISTVGSGLLGNVTAGVLLYAAHVTASILIGILGGRGHRRAPSDNAPTVAQDAPADVVRDTCLSLLTMCGYVVLAATMLTLWDALQIASVIQRAVGVPAAAMTAGVSALTEVSCGCVAIAGQYRGAPFWMSMCLGWGGLSVQGQLTALLGDDLRHSGWRWWRLAHGVMSGGIAVLLFSLFPAAAQTVGTIPVERHPYTASATASVMLMMMSFMAMWLFSAKSTGNREKSVVHWYHHR